ncbi:MAG: hypothetical protein RIC95_04460, partial [Vicingaceae bacterium]
IDGGKGAYIGDIRDSVSANADGIVDSTNSLLSRIDVDSLLRYEGDTTLAGNLRDSTAMLRDRIDTLDTDDQFLTATQDSILIDGGKGAYIGDIRNSISTLNAGAYKDSSATNELITNMTIEDDSLVIFENGLETARLSLDSLGNQERDSLLGLITTNQGNISNNVTGILDSTSNVRAALVDTAQDIRNSISILNAGAYKDSSATNELITNMTIEDDSLVIFENGLETARLSLDSLGAQERDSLLGLIANNESAILSQDSRISQNESDIITINGVAMQNSNDILNNQGLIGANQLSIANNDSRIKADSLLLEGHLIADGDLDATNELNTTLELNGKDLELTDAGGTLTEDLSIFADTTSVIDTASQIRGALIDTANDIRNSITTLNAGAYKDSSEVNELQSISRSGSDLTLSNGGGTVNIDDADADASNELNTALTLNGTTLEITDAGGTITEDLSSLAIGDDLGNHQLDSNLKTNGHYISADGDDEGILIDNDGHLGLGSAPDSDARVTIEESNAESGISVTQNSSDDGRIAVKAEVQGISGGSSSAFALEGVSTAQAANSYGSHAVARGASTINYGSFGKGQGASLTNYGVYGEALGTSTSENIGVYGKSSGLGTNWAGYFADGNVKIENDLFAEGVSFIDSLRINNAYAFPTADGDSDWILKTDGAGQLDFVPISSLVSGDNLGNHTLDSNLRTAGNFISADGDDEGIRIDSAGRVSIGGFKSSGERFSVIDTLQQTNGGYIASLFYSKGTNSSTAFQRAIASGIQGSAGSNEGIFSHSYGVSTGTNLGVIGRADSGIVNIGVEGYVDNLLSNNGNRGVSGTVNANGLNNYGLYGSSFGNNTKNNIGVYGNAENGATNWAGYFDQGDVFITDTLRLNNPFTLTDGAVNGFVLATNANGVATWQDPNSLVFDSDQQNLGSASSGPTRFITITSGTGTSIDIRDNDSDASNELQNLSINGANDSLLLSNGDGVPLSSINTAIDTFSIIRTADSSAYMSVSNSNEADIALDDTVFFKFSKNKLEFLETFSTIIGRDAAVNYQSFRNTEFTAIGFQALRNNTTGSGNLAIGTGGVLMNNTTGTENTAVGHINMRQNTGGNRNSAFGTGAMDFYFNGDENTAIGQRAMENGNDGDFNTAIGGRALNINGAGDNNVAVGYGAGHSSNGGSNNVFLGFNAGFNETTSDKLYIENSNSTTPLIYGDFAEDSLVFNGKLFLDSAKDGSGYTFPGLRGTNGQVLTSDGAGNAIWQDASTGTDNQTLSLSGSGNGTLNISNGNRIFLPDSSNTNEIQTLSNVGSTYTLSDGGGSFSTDDADADNTNEAQTLSKTGSTVTLTQANGAGGGTFTDSALTSTQVLGFVAADGYLKTEVDGSVTNELQDLSINGASDSLLLSNGDGVKLSDIVSADTLDIIQANDSNFLTIKPSGVDIAFNNDRAYHFNDNGMYFDGKNIFISQGLGVSGTGPLNNTTIGNDAFGSATANTNRNTSVGVNTLSNLTDGGGNAAIGERSLQFLQTGNTNVAIGSAAGGGTTLGSNNVLIGHDAGRGISEIDNSIIIGQGIQGTMPYTSISNVIKIGEQAGVNDSTDNRLYIDNLIYGELDNEILQINGAFRTSFSGGDTLSYPTLDGTTDQILKTDGSGNLSFVDVSSLVSGDNLGNHTLDSNLRLNGSYISNDGDDEGISIANDGLVTISNDAIINGITVGKGNNSLSENTAVGNRALESINTGNANVAIGLSAGQLLTNGIQNTTVGSYAMQNNTIGNLNSSFGYRSLYDLQSGDQNTAMGFHSGHSIRSGSFNVLLGAYAGDASADNQIGVVKIGYRSGSQDTTDNKLYIENSNSNTPLIYGNFADDSLKIYGTLSVDSAKDGSGYTFPGADGTNGQVLQTDGSGNVSWSAVSGGGASAAIEDADGDTKIQVEESADEDIIRFDVGGREHFRMRNKGRLDVLNNGKSVFIGENAGLDDVHSALVDNHGVFVGYQAGENNTFGDDNVFIGSEAGQINSTGSWNTFIGKSAGNQSNGWGNTYIGHESGLNSTGSSNVFIGKESGRNESGSNKLYIENSNGSSPLIYGDFAKDSLVFNGKLFLDSAKDGSGYAFPGADGTNGQVLQTDGSGQLSFVDASTVVSSVDTAWNYEAYNDLKLNDNFLSNDGDSEGIRISDDGNVTVEKAADSRLTLFNNAGQSEFNLYAFGTGLSSGSEINFHKATGTHGTNSTVADNDQIFEINSSNFVSGSGYVTFPLIRAEIDGNVIGTNVPTSLAFTTRKEGGGQGASMYLRSNGNVGIGSAAFDPDSTLTVDGGIEADYIRLIGGATNGYILGSDGNGNATWQDPSTLFAGDGNGIYSGGGTLSGGTTVNLSNQTLNFNSGLSGVFQVSLSGVNSDFFVKGSLPTDDYFTVDGVNGRVGINTENPQAQLHVAGNSRFDGTINTNNQWVSGDGDAEGINIDNNGNVGIGTTSSGAMLEVNDVNNNYTARFVNTAVTSVTYGVYAEAIGVGSGTNHGLYATASGGISGNYAAVFDQGKVQINDTLVIPTGAGNGKVLTSDPTGKAYWSTVDTAVCPANMTNIAGRICIENDQRAATDWFAAASGCAADGYKLPSWAEWYGALDNAAVNDETNDWEWVDDGTSNTARKAGNGSLKASANDDPDSGSAAYRCILILK